MPGEVFQSIKFRLRLWRSVHLMRMLKVPAPDHMDSALYKLFQRDNSALQGCSSGFGTISHVELVEHVADV
jgi:hypothetical protein